MRTSKEKGFTLIELLVVVAIIGLLASVVLASMSTARSKGRDARRLADMATIQRALELYWSDNRQYPDVDGACTSTAVCGASGVTNWGTLETKLANYISKLPRETSSDTTFSYFYDSDTGNTYKDYALATSLESTTNYWRVNNDGGYFNGMDSYYYEVGEQPAYCVRRYGSGASGNWWTGSTNVCAGGD